MARANRHFFSDSVWHITHRCHNKEFLLNFICDRRNWLRWLFQAKLRFDLCILNYIVTSNHIHLLVFEKTGENSIPHSMQLVAGRTGQDYNRRKKRRGAFWEDRYHATAVETDDHLADCMTYIDLNMVRANAVDIPADWAHSGYFEIQNPSERYSLIDRKQLISLLDLSGFKDLQDFCQYQIEKKLASDGWARREAQWTESVAVGSHKFTAETKSKLGVRAKGRKITNSLDGSTFKLSEPETTYNVVSDTKNRALRSENTHLWMLKE